MKRSEFIEKMDKLPHFISRWGLCHAFRMVFRGRQSFKLTDKLSNTFSTEKRWRFYLNYEDSNMMPNQEEDLQVRLLAIPLFKEICLSDDFYKEL